MTYDTSGIQKGYEVYGSDGDKIGKVDEVATNYFTVEKGFLFKKEVYIPTSAITSVDGTDVRLNIAKNDVGNKGWDQPPAEGTTTTSSDVYGQTGETTTRPQEGSYWTQTTDDSVSTESTADMGSTSTASTGTVGTGFADLSSIHKGDDVYASDGQKIGDVEEVGNDYIKLDRSYFQGDIYVPSSAITNIAEDRVDINTASSQIESIGWNQMPTTGYQSTTTDTGHDYDTQTSETRTSDEGATRIPRHEEELVAEKGEREAGRVQISKDVEEQEQTLDVPVTSEEVHVTSRTVDRPATDTDEAFREETLEVPVHEETVDTHKETRVAEELDVEKRAREDTERVSDTVRKERFDVTEEGDVDVDQKEPPVHDHVEGEHDQYSGQ